jgi:4'-phosphopantetheinyl transferase EntD
VLIAEILPAEAVVAEAFEDLSDGLLYSEEEALIVRAVEKRRREFTTGRVCARRALAKLGVPPAPIMPGLRGAPQWPQDVVGSITHCLGYCAAAVAPAGEIVALGIDAEPNEALPDGVVESVGSASEIGALRDFARQAPGICWDRLLFSAKESVYKAWFPMTGQWLGFEDVVVTLDDSGGGFSARLVVAGPVVAGRNLTEFTGRWLARDGLLATVVAVARRAGRS